MKTARLRQCSGVQARMLWKQVAAQNRRRFQKLSMGQIKFIGARQFALNASPCGCEVFSAPRNCPTTNAQSVPSGPSRSSATRTDPSRSTRLGVALVAKGFVQKYGIDYTETFSPVVKYVTLRMIIAIAKYFGWPIDQLDVVTAFLNGLMKEKVFCSVPEGVELDDGFDCVELLKAIYGLKQASRVWNETFDE
ncbi:unnamed protein product [Phytophthora fragariaefolia]|uniref:Unnamed protein product n=1 Tax=Phytophthora fragariaefolia TaxID=1490495 RepID=A0A9W6YQ04_9STRA|nr:unnamed protein product [Phytophthora fragariaefolia]